MPWTKRPSSASGTDDAIATGTTDDAFGEFADLADDIRATRPAPAHSPDWTAMRRAIDDELDELDHARANASLWRRLSTWWRSPWALGGGALAVAAAALLLATSLSRPSATEPPSSAGNALATQPESDGDALAFGDVDIESALATTVFDLDGDQLDRALALLGDDDGLATGFLDDDLLAESLDEDPFGPPLPGDIDLEDLTDDELDELAAIFAG